MVKFTFLKNFRDSKYLENWHGFLMFLTIIAGIEIPLRMVFDIQGERWIRIDFFLSLFFILDFIIILISLDYSIENSQNSFRNYLRTWFTIDLLAAIPFHLIIGIYFDTQGLKALRLIRLTRMLKLAKIVPLIRRLEILKSLNPSLVRMILFFFLLLFVAHWMACGWIALSDTKDILDPFSIYIRAVYWVITTMTTVGYGDITPNTNSQIIYAIIVMIIGVATYGYVIANLSSYFGNIDTARSEFTRKMAILNAFLVYREIPTELEMRIRSYYNYIWDNRMDHSEDEVINELPDSLKLDIKLYLRQPLISKVPMFQLATPEFRNEIVHYLNIHVYMPGDIIVRKDEPGDSMFFVSRGKVEILDDRDDTFAMLEEGSFFGETSLLRERPRNATVRAISFCNVYSLSKEIFDRMLLKYPKFKADLEKISNEREFKHNDKKI